MIKNTDTGPEIYNQGSILRIAGTSLAPMINFYSIDLGAGSTLAKQICK